MDATLGAELERRERVVRRLQELLVERLHLPQEPDEIDPDAPLLGGGLDLDSIDALELVVGMERTFGVGVPNSETARQVLGSVNTIHDYIAANRPS
jgi:acyl carrier protein